jgi:hypothetical protein
VDRSRFKHEALAHAGQQSGIEAIGLGQASDGLCKASGLSRIDLDDRQVCLRKSSFEEAMISPGRLENDPHRHSILCRDPAQKPCQAGLVVGEPPGVAAGHAANIERGFRDIDADGNICHLLPSLCLSFGLRRPGIRSGLREKTRVIQL